MITDKRHLHVMCGEARLLHLGFVNERAARARSLPCACCAGLSASQTCRTEMLPPSRSSSGYQRTSDSSLARTFICHLGRTSPGVANGVSPCSVGAAAKKAAEPNDSGPMPRREAAVVVTKDEKLLRKLPNMEPGSKNSSNP